MTAEYHNIEEKWLESFPTHWKMCRLKDYTSTNTGITFTKADLVESGNAVLSYGQIHAKNNPTTKINHELIRFIPDAFVTDKQSSKVKEGDFIFADTSEDLNGCGNCIYINEPMDLYAGYHTIILRNKGLNCGKYFAYLFMTDQWRSQIRKRVKSVKLYSVTQGILNQTFIIVPPIEEQELIVSYLDKECDKITREIDLLERKVDCYRRLRRSLINRAVTRGLDPNIPLKPSGSDWIGDIPQHWNLRPLRNFITLISPEKKGLNDYLLLSVTRDRGVIVRGERGEDGNNNRIPEDLSNYKVVHKNQFVVNKMKAWMGSYGVSDFDGIVSPAYYVCSVHDIYELFFSLAIRCKMYTNFFWKYSKGIRVDQWDMSPLALKEIPFVTPPKNEQKEITEYLDEKCSKIDSIIEKIELKIERLKELKRSLINEVVTGRCTIKTSDL